MMTRIMMDITLWARWT